MQDRRRALAACAQSPLAALGFDAFPLYSAAGRLRRYRQDYKLGKERYSDELSTKCVSTFCKVK